MIPLALEPFAPELSGMHCPLLITRRNDLWYFDFAPLGVVDEPFVEGIEKILDHIAAADCPGHDGELVLDWTPTGNLRHRLEWICRLDREDGEWNRYELYSIGHPPLRGNLCPVLRMFFPDEAPQVLNFQLYPATPAIRERVAAASAASV